MNSRKILQSAGLTIFTSVLSQQTGDVRLSKFDEPVDEPTEVTVAASCEYVEQELISRETGRRRVELLSLPVIDATVRSKVVDQDTVVAVNEVHQL